MQMVSRHREAGFCVAAATQYLAQIGASIRSGGIHDYVLDAVANLLQTKIYFRMADPVDAEAACLVGRPGARLDGPRRPRQPGAHGDQPRRADVARGLHRHRTRHVQRPLVRRARRHDRIGRNDGAPGLHPPLDPGPVAAPHPGHVARRPLRADARGARRPARVGSRPRRPAGHSRRPRRTRPIATGARARTRRGGAGGARHGRTPRHAPTPADRGRNAGVAERRPTRRSRSRRVRRRRSRARGRRRRRSAHRTQPAAPTRGRHTDRAVRVGDATNRPPRATRRSRPASGRRRRRGRLRGLRRADHRAGRMEERPRRRDQGRRSGSTRGTLDRGAGGARRRPRRGEDRVGRRSGCERRAASRARQAHRRARGRPTSRRSRSAHRSSRSSRSSPVCRSARRPSSRH